MRKTNATRTLPPQFSSVLGHEDEERGPLVARTTRSDGAMSAFWRPRPHAPARVLDLAAFVARRRSEP
jgi:hypothetical protein